MHWILIIWNSNLVTDKLYDTEHKLALADTTFNIYYCYCAFTKPKAHTTTCTTCTKAHTHSVQQQFIIATGLYIAQSKHNYITDYIITNWTANWLYFKLISLKRLSRKGYYFWDDWLIPVYLLTILQVSVLQVGTSSRWLPMKYCKQWQFTVLDKWLSKRNKGFNIKKSWNKYAFSQLFVERVV